MPRMARQMVLTAELVARVHRIVEDTGPEPDRVYHTEQDYDAAVAESLASHSAGEDAWLFAYGSLTKNASEMPTAGTARSGCG